MIMFLLFLEGDVFFYPPSQDPLTLEYHVLYGVL